MQNFQSVLITAAFPEPYRTRVEEALRPAKVTFCSPRDTAVIDQALAEADGAILGSDITDRILRGKHLKWVHCDHSGLNQSARKEVFDRHIAVTGSAGRSAPTLAEHAIFFMLSLTYDAQGLFRLQQDHRWGGLPGYDDRRGLIDKTVGIIGLGHTGQELAARCKAFGMRVLGYRRNSRPVEGVDHLFSADGGDTISPLLEQSDYLVLTVQLSDATYHMIGREQLLAMKPAAYLINMSRGSIVDEAALASALADGTIAGAGLDTFEVEPLPSGSPLWDMKNVIITPHNTPTVPNRWERSCEIVCDNIRRWQQGKPLRNQIGLRDLFTREV